MFGGGAAGGAPGGGLFGGMPMPTPEQMAQMQAMMGGGGGFGGFGGPPAPPADSRPAHERFADQLAQLQGMGFYDGQKNLEALQRSGGNVCVRLWPAGRRASADLLFAQSSVQFRRCRIPDQSAALRKI